jgi:hypothetical protein
VRWDDIDTVLVLINKRLGAARRFRWEFLAPNARLNKSRDIWWISLTFDFTLANDENEKVLKTSRFLRSSHNILSFKVSSFRQYFFSIYKTAFIDPAKETLDRV